jgi:dTDP-4-dehydrorhamnose reductase
MRTLLFGRSGQLGWELERALNALGSVTAVGRSEVDLIDLEALRRAIRSGQPDLIVNASAYTQVDRAEGEADLARRINATAPRVMAEEASRLGCPLIHYSTDYVFDGESDRPYDERDRPRPLNVYGTSKLEGEQDVQAVGGAYLILRASWVYSLRRKSFVAQVLNWARTQPTMHVVDDQIGSPTWCRALAQTTTELIAGLSNRLTPALTERAGVYHLAGSGAVSRWEWAKMIVELDPRQREQVVRTIEPAKTSEFPTPARRPLYSALNCDLFEGTFGLRLPDWVESLRAGMAEA